MNRNFLVIAAAVALVGAFAFGMYAFNKQEQGQARSAADANAASLVREGAPAMGSDDARVTIVEFFDPACGTCAAFHPIVKDIMNANPGKVKLVMRYLPLHTGSPDVVRILEAARMQGKYWEALEAGYKAQRAWAINHQAHPDLFWQSIAAVGLDADRVAADMQSLTITRNIEQDLRAARQLGVDKTPGFFVNGQPLSPFGEMPLRQLVDEALVRAYGK